MTFFFSGDGNWTGYPAICISKCVRCSIEQPRVMLLRKLGVNYFYVRSEHSMSARTATAVQRANTRPVLELRGLGLSILLRQRVGHARLAERHVSGVWPVVAASACLCVRLAH